MILQCCLSVCFLWKKQRQITVTLSHIHYRHCWQPFSPKWKWTTFEKKRMQSNKIGVFKSLTLQCCLDNIWECNQTKLGISNQDTDKFCGNSARFGGQTKIANSEYWRRRHICKNYARSHRDVFAKIRFLSRPVFFETVINAKVTLSLYWNKLKIAANLKNTHYFTNWFDVYFQTFTSTKSPT